MKPASCKKKGRALQNLVRDSLTAELGIPPEDILSVPGGVPGCDILLSASARRRFPYGIECKNQASLRLGEALDQTVRNAEIAGLTPLLVFKRRGESPWAVLPWVEFVQLIKRVTELENKS